MKIDIYLFAETPRAVSDHPAIVPTRNAADAAVRNQYIPPARDGKTGKDFISVCQAAPRTRLGKSDRSTETLVLAVPGYDLSELKNRQQIERKLKEYLDLIAESNDWAKENRSVVPLEQFSVWQEGLAAMIPNNLPKLSPTNNNMGLKLFGVVFLVLSVVFGIRSCQAENNPLQNWFSRWISMSNAPEHTQVVTNLKNWLTALGVKHSATDENTLKKELWNTLSQAFETKVPLDELQTKLLPNLATCLRYEKKDKLILLEDTQFRSKVAKLFEQGGKKTGVFNPFGTIQDVLENWDESLQTPWCYIHKGNETIEPELKLEENHQCFRNVGDMLDAATKVEKVEQHNIAQEMLRIIGFVKQLNFTQGDTELYQEWKKIDAMKPMFVTALDIAVTKKMYEWLKCSDANAVLGGNQPNNYKDAVERFRDWDIDETISPRDLLDKSGNSIEALATLKAALQKLQGTAKLLFPVKKK